MVDIKIALILPYFGKLPNYFNLYLLSCKFNPQIDWLLLTDDKTIYNYPNNVKVIYVTFNEIQERIKKKFDFPISILYPNKLCDYRPAYGYIFEELITGYDFWGYCDSDCIWGDLSKFITQDILKIYDKIFTLGHLTLFKNTKSINQIFQLSLNKRERYKDVFQTKYGCAFDEQNKQSINDIFETTDYQFYKVNCCADIDPYHQNFRLSIYDQNKRVYFLENTKKQVFVWEKGILLKIYKNNKNVITEEFGYIHLQKRKMEDYTNNTTNEFLIIPNQFISVENREYSLLLEKYYIQYFFNFQFIKVKWNSLKFRINKIKCL